MADSKISALTSATTPLAGTEVLPIVQSGATKQVSVANLTAGRSISASGLTLTGGTANGVLYLNGSQVATSGTALVFDGTNLGIGTSTMTGRVNIVGSAVSSIQLVFDTNASYGEIQTYSSSPLYLNRQGNNIIANSGGGNFGIATTAPSYLLSLGGTAARTIGMERHTTANTAGNNLTLLAGGATSGATDKVGGNLVLSSGTATGTGTSVITFLTATAGTTGTADRSPTEKMRIDGAGNVGLNTTTLTYALSFDANSARTVGMVRHTTANTAGNNFTILAGSATSGATDKAGGSLLLSSGTATGTGTSVITFLTATAGTTGTADRAPTEKMRIDGAGNVGLNTTTLTYALSFTGNAACTVGMVRHTTANTAGNNLTVLAGAATSGATDKAGGNLVLSSGTATGTGTSVITFLTAPAGTTGTADRAPTEKLRITGAGNIHTPAGSTGMTDGFIYIPAAAGAPSGAATAISGTVPLYYDSTNNALYTYNASWRNLSASLSLVSTNANGVVYLNGSSQATTSTSFTYDGSAVTIAGNLTFSGTGRLITGDFSNATVSSRTNFQTSTINSATGVCVIPNGTASGANYAVLNSSTAANCGYGNFLIDSSAVKIVSSKLGTGTTLPVTFEVDGVERMRISAAGLVGIGTNSPGDKLEVSVASGIVVSGTRSYGTSGTATDYAQSLVSVAGANTGLISNIMYGTGYGYTFSNAPVIYYVGTSGATPLGFYTNGVERMRVDSGGNVGIGTTPTSGWATGAKALEIPTFITFNNTLGGALFYNLYYDNTSNYKYINTNTGNAFGLGPSGCSWYTVASGTSGTNAAIVEKMRLTIGGYLSVNSNALLNADTHSFYAGSANSTLTLRNTNNASGRFWYVGPDTYSSFVVFNDQAVGAYLAYNGNTWITGSDERLKTDLVPIQDAVTKVCTLRAVTGRLKTDEVGKSRAFLIAQDVQKVLPEAVNVRNDEQGTLGLAYTDVIPLLVAAIKEQQAMINELKERIQLLEDTH